MKGDWWFYFILANIALSAGISIAFAKKHYQEGYVRGCEQAAYDLTKSYDGRYKQCYEENP